MDFETFSPLASLATVVSLTVGGMLGGVVTAIVTKFRTGAQERVAGGLAKATTNNGFRGKKGCRGCRELTKFIEGAYNQNER